MLQNDTGYDTSDSVCFWHYDYEYDYVCPLFSLNSSSYILMSLVVLHWYTWYYYDGYQYHHIYSGVNWFDF